MSTEVAQEEDPATDDDDPLKGRAGRFGTPLGERTRQRNYYTAPKSEIDALDVKKANREAMLARFKETLLSSGCLEPIER